MKPALGKNDIKMFYKYLDKAKVFFEYGSGGSTFQASIRSNIKKIYSVESDKGWYNKVKKQITNKKLNYIYNEMDTQPNNWGQPGPKSTPSQKINYSNHMRNISQEEQKRIDLIFIDGRFRVACCLKCFDIIRQDCLIALSDDFLDRNKKGYHYHMVLDYYDIIDQTKDNRMVILRKKQNIDTVPEELITTYELLPNQ